MRSRGLLLPVVLLVAGLGFSGVAGAAAALPEGERAQGQWYSDRFDYAGLAQSGATGAGVKIAVIDSAVNLDAPELRGANIRVMGAVCLDPDTGEQWDSMNTDPVISEHGTNVVAMLVGNGVAGDGGVGARGIAPEAEIMFYGIGPIEPLDADGRISYWDSCIKHDPTVPPGEDSLLADSPLLGEPFDNRDGADPGLAKEMLQGGSSTALATRAAIRDGADVVSVSIDSSAVNEWVDAMIEALRAGVPVVIGTDNPRDILFDGRDAHAYQANGIVAVNAVEPDGAPLKGGAKFEAWGNSNLAVAAPGRDLLGVGTAAGWGPELVHGTSYATPLVAGTIALGLQKFPEATANQVLQAMIRTTDDGALREPEWQQEEYGYGLLNPAAMLAADPMLYPDENPLYVTTLEDPRCTYPEDGLIPGSPGHLDAGLWRCYWAGAPNPDDEAEYWAERGEAGVEDPAATDGDSAAAVRPEAVPMWALVAGGAGLLLLVATAVLVPVLVTRSRRRERARAWSA